MIRLLTGVLLGLLVLGWQPPSSQAATVEVTTVNWAPYYGDTLDDGGVIAALARAAFEQQGHEMTVAFIPWKRAMAMTKRGKYDAVLGAYYSDDRAKDFIFSEPFYEIEVGFMALNDLGMASYDSLTDLKGYTIGYNDGWAYGEAFEEADYLNKQAASNQTLNVRKLFGDRVDMVAMARGIFRYEVSKLENASLSDVTFVEPLLMTGKLHMMFGEDHPKAEQLRDDFNAGLKAIRANGTYDEIVDAYGF